MTITSSLVVGNGSNVNVLATAQCVGSRIKNIARSVVIYLVARDY
jgi:hypothetical protein